MPFGSGYTMRESGVSLECGTHQAKIIQVTPETTDYGKRIVLKFEMDGQKQAYPDTGYIYDRPTEPFGQYTAEARQEMWDKTVTKFFNSFGIVCNESSFRDLQKWVGKTGKVTVRLQKKNPEYKEIVLYEMQQKKGGTQKPETPESPAPVQPHTASDGFPEDIPF